MRDLQSKPAEDASVEQAAELPKAVQRQDEDGCEEAAEQLAKDIDESSVPEAIEDQSRPQDSRRIQCCACVRSGCRGRLALKLAMASNALLAIFASI